jgi:trk system potassium uptake protein TrkA
MAYAIITGGGKIGYYLARSLINNDYEVLLMERTPAPTDDWLPTLAML